MATTTRVPSWLMPALLALVTTLGGAAWADMQGDVDTYRQETKVEIRALKTAVAKERDKTEEFGNRLTRIETLLEEINKKL